MNLPLLTKRDDSMMGIGGDDTKDHKIIRNRWVFDLKSDGHKKARLVTKGFSQVEGIDYDKIFSLVVWFETVRMMVALVALKKWHIQGLDVETAFLYGELDKELYMEQPKGFKIKGQEGKVMHLNISKIKLILFHLLHLIPYLNLLFWG